MDASIKLIYTSLAGSTTRELFSRCISYLFIGGWSGRIRGILASALG